MFFKKYTLIVFLVLLKIHAFSQKTDSVFLKWKLKPGEIIAYKTTFEEIDTANNKDLAMNGFMRTMGDNADTADFQKVFKQLSKIAVQSNFVTYLKESRNNIIDIEMHL